MCSIVVLNQVRSDYPVVIATNRDEFFARKTSGPECLLDLPRTVGGRDLEAGGTWMGVTREGLFVGVTNQRTFAAPDPTRSSRGELVMEALRLGDSQAICEMLNAIDGRAYNSFNLMFGGAAGLWVAYGRKERREVELEPVPAGIHVLPNDVLDAPDFYKVQRARALVEPFAQAPWDTLAKTLRLTLADRVLPDLSLVPEPPQNPLFDRALLRELAALCVRTPVYGTRSSTLVALTSAGTARFEYADGPPDQTPFVDVMDLYERPL